MNTDEKIDLNRLHKEDYVASTDPVLVDVKAATYLSISGQGEMGGAVFLDKVGALYSVAYKIRMTRKYAGLGDYAFSRLEAQSFGPFGAHPLSFPKDQWCWKLLLRTPDFVTPADLSEASASFVRKGSPTAKEVQIESLDEGLCAQMLHVGPYDREPETVLLMHAYAQKQGFVFCGRHHEIFLSDPRRVPPESLRTILRRPVRKA